MLNPKKNNYKNKLYCMAESLNEIIAKFDNGKQRFELDPLFNKVV